MEVQQRPDVDVADAVAVGQHEALLVAQVGGKPAEPAARHRLLAGFDEGDAPIRFFVGGGQPLDALGAELHREVAVQQVVVEEVVLDHLALVAKREDEIGEAKGRVGLHDVPEDRPVADWHQRLRPVLRFLSESGAQAATEDDDPGLRLAGDDSHAHWGASAAVTGR